MRIAIKKAFKIFKYLSVLFTLVYWIGVIIDDYVFIEKYWDTHWLEYIGTWSLFFLIYFLVFSFYFWFISLTIILIYHKLIKRTKKQAGNHT